MNNAAVNTGVQISLLNILLSIILDTYPEVVLLDHMRSPKSKSPAFGDGKERKGGKKREVKRN